MVMEVVHEDIGEANNMQCTNHPYKNSSPGGICAFCLQEKLGKLVSSSFPVPIFPSSSSSPSPSFRSDFTTTAAAAAGGGGGGVGNPQSGGNESSNSNGYHTRKSRLPFVRRKKNNGGGVLMEGSDSTSIVFKRSRSIATPRRGMNFMDEDCGNNSPQRRGFWSFLHLSKHPTSKKSEKALKDVNFTPTTPSTVCVVDENGSSSPDEGSFDRKVSRSRSVGCGSRSFSGDFFERISTGFGDCTLRRVESQREGKSKVQPSSVHRNGGSSERVRCGGIFSGFMITSSSSSSSSSNSYWVEDNNNSKNNNGSGKSICASSSVRHVSHGRSKSWGWALASPMRAFSRPSSLKRDNNSGSNKNVGTPNLAAIPSLLAVSG
ncbi:hypothetical protein BUALT_Bualt14G0064100 [Buddleja alternifolia]|uniref:Vitellogenin-like protein n=1 Tax=Buddleja alternifolia TaxID=168488 RepID=A0AAV6WFH1_9LAMI|nr:hypothetical protein BUALT_Bualt14G0064100 [Buddleja alternifolia]